LVFWLAERLHTRYRVRQFWHALAAAPSTEELRQASQALSPELMRLFLRQHPSEQAHSLKIFSLLREQGETSPDLLNAALIHDVGKSRYPLRIWERVLVVIIQALAPGKAQQWGRAEPRGWKRPFVVASQHPTWGAEMAQACGASVLTTALIRRHHDTPCSNPAQPEDELLRRFQSLDSKN
jgi:hypothetical protein